MDIGYPKHCINCGQGFYPTSIVDDGLCPNCLTSDRPFNTIDTTNIYSYDISELTFYDWEGFRVISKFGKSFMYKKEDDWYVWTEVENVINWENGIIYQTKKIDDFMEYFIRFVNETRAKDTTIITYTYGVSENPVD